MSDLGSQFDNLNTGVQVWTPERLLGVRLETPERALCSDLDPRRGVLGPICYLRFRVLARVLDQICGVRFGSLEGVVGILIWAPAEPGGPICHPASPSAVTPWCPHWFSGSRRPRECLCPIWQPRVLGLRFGSPTFVGSDLVPRIGL